MARTWRSLALLPALSALLLAAGCPGGSGKSDAPDSEVGGVGEVQSGFVAVGSTEKGNEDEGPVFGLRESAPPSGAGYQPVPAADAKTLPEADTKTLLGRLPELEPAQTKDFARREGPPPPKLTGDTIKTPFPPPAKPDAPPAAEPGPLKVLRYQPEGDVPLAPHVSLSFSRPMVALGSVGHLAEGPFPAKLSPTVPGRWRWLGTRTLVFEPEAERFPMATEFQVEVPAGVAAADGTQLGEALRWSFRTPAPKVVASSPQGGPTVLEPLLMVRFDQRVDPEAVLASIKVSAQGEPIALRLASEEERAGRVIPQPERALLFKPAAPLPGDQQIRVDVGPGTPSAEGPRRSEQPHSFSFRTYGPLKIVRHRSGWGRDCPPGAPFTIEFNNPLDAKAFAKSSFAFDPEIEALDVACHGRSVVLRGLTRANTRYTCTVSAKLLDRFGQTLGQDRSLTFQTTAPHPQLSGIGQQVLILDPSGDPELEVRSIAIPKLQVRIYRVNPERDWQRFQAWKRGRHNRGGPPPAPGATVFDEVVDVPGSDEAWVKTKVDISRALTKGTGHAVVSVEPYTWKNRWKPRVDVWVQATQLGVSTAHDAKEALAWVTRLKDGSPVGGAQVRFLGGAAVSADDSGLARLPLGGRREVLLASHGGDTVLLPGYWRSSNPGVSLRWFSFDDRHLYRPKETVKVKGWVRRYDSAEGGDILPLGAAPRGDWRVVDAHGQEIAKGRAEFDAWGSFTLSFELPDTIHVGQARLYFSAGHAHTFQVAEFRRPEFEVEASVGSAGPHFGGEALTLSAKASYFAGGALPNAPVKWKVEARPGSFTPPNRSEFAFGNYVPWWARHSYGRLSRGRHARFGPSHPPALHTQHLAGRTGATGKHHVAVDLRATTTPLTISASATVQDVNRQAWAGSTTVLVHPAEVYVGLKLASPYVGSGRDLILDALVVDHDGAAVSGREVVVVFEKMRWTWEQGRYVEQAVSRLERKLTSGEEAARVVVKKPKGGFYRIKATVRDAKGRESLTTSQVWVAGGEGPSSRKVEEERVTLIPDRQSYQGGDKANLLVIAPFAPAEGLLTLRRSGIVETRRFHMKDSTTVLEVEISDEHVPNLEAHVSLVGQKLRSGEKKRTRPAFAAGQVTLKVPPTRRSLSLSVNPAHKELVPGSETSAEVVVLDHEGKPVPGAQVALAVVDEAILSLSGHSQPDPLAVFYAPRPAGASDARVRALLRLQAPKLPEEQARLEEAEAKSESLRGNAMADGAPAPGAPRRSRSQGRAQDAFGAGEGGGGGGGSGLAGPAIDLRKDLRALAVFAPAQVTDAAGKTTVRYTLPDSLTRYRLVAVAAGKTNRFGSSEATLTARLPLQVRPSPPRFLNFGDRCELPIVIQNQTDAPLEVALAIRASNLSFSAGQGRTLTLPPRDRREVRFPVAAVQAGEVRLQVAAAAGEHVDAQELTFPVWTPATSEAFATYGTLDGEATAVAQPVAPPKGAWPQFGGLEITTSSTGLSALTDAVIYLSEYPYGCAEQVSSRVIALAAVRDVLQAFEAEGVPSAATLAAHMDADLLRLRTLQNGDGGWGFWRRDERSWPYLSIHVGHALFRAQDKGYAVPKGMLQRSLAYLRTIERRIPKTYSEASRRALIAYALYVREKFGDRDVKRARALLSEAGITGLSFEALGWIYPLLRKGGPGGAADAKTIRRFLGNRVSETAGLAHFVTNYSDGEHVLLHSSRRVDGILLEALLDDPAEAKGELVSKLVQGLLAHRKRGRWLNTQENAFILLAFDRYFHTAEAVTPDYMARAWLGDTFAGEHAFRGRTTERAHVDVPMRLLQQRERPQLTIAKDGPGRLYYRIGLRYAPKDLALPPLEAGFTVERRYEAVDDPKDVRREQDGTWRIKAGARVRVRVTMLAPTRRYHVALVDPLPAGLEPLDPALAATGPLPADPEGKDQRRMGCWWWSRTWYEHSGLRDERAEAFTSLLWAGVHTYTYVTRATTPGTFVAPPAKAEEMYHPETFGRSATDKVVVE